MKSLLKRANNMTACSTGADNQRKKRNNNYQYLQLALMRVLSEANLSNNWTLDVSVNRLTLTWKNKRATNKWQDKTNRFNSKDLGPQVINLKVAQSRYPMGLTLP